MVKLKTILKEIKTMKSLQVKKVDKISWISGIYNCQDIEGFGKQGQRVSLWDIGDPFYYLVGSYRGMKMLYFQKKACFDALSQDNRSITKEWEKDLIPIVNNLLYNKKYKIKFRHPVVWPLEGLSRQ